MTYDCGLDESCLDEDGFVRAGDHPLHESEGRQLMQPDRVGPDRHDRIHRLIAGLRTETLNEGQQLAVNKLEKTMLGSAQPVAPPKRAHEHGVFLCCLQELVVQVKEYASELTEVEPDKVEALLELLSLHVEEGWESFDGDIVAPESADSYEERRADFDDDVMSDLLKE